MEFSYTPAEVYIVMMDISLCFTFYDKGPGTLLWTFIDYSLNHSSFASSDARALAKIACYYKRPVRVRPDLAKIDDIRDATTTCVLELIMPWYNANDREIVDWEIEFSFPTYQTKSQQGKLSKLSDLFIENRDT
jgi:hypothetical protein